MNLSRLRLASLAVGLLAAGVADAATITVYASMAGSPTTGTLAAVGKVTDFPAPVSPAVPVVNCSTNAPAGCVGDAAIGSTLVLRASNTNNAAFVGWSGCSSVTVDGDCSITVSAAKTIQATFRPIAYALNLKTHGAGGWLTTTTTVPPGDCVTGAVAPALHTVCATASANGAPVVITANLDAGVKVASWSGCTTSDATTCTIASLLASRVVSATFGPVNVPVTAQVQGGGTITAAAGGAVSDGMSCPGDCSAQVTPGGAITLVATATGGNKFVGWTGCVSTSNVCTISNVTSAKAVTATFKGGNCNACHEVPPAWHAAEGWTTSSDCAACHGDGYTTSSVAAASHMNGRVNVNQLPAPIPADAGFNVEVVDFTLTGGTGGKPTVDMKLTNAAGACINPVTGIPAGVFHSGVGATGSSRVPRVAIGEVQLDGSFLSKLGTTSLVTSETGSAVAQWSVLDAATCSYRYTLTNSAGRTPQDLTRTWRAVVYGAVYFKPVGEAAVQLPNSDFLDKVPAGVAASTTPVELVSDAACNACHGKVTLHGMRRGVAICLTCHNPNMPLGNATTGPNVASTDAFRWDLKNLVHKLHSGKNYGTINRDAAGVVTSVVQPVKPDGTAGVGWFSTNTTTGAISVTMDASHMMMGPSHSTYLEAADGATVVDPGLMGAECGVCHQGANADLAFSRVTRAGCGSCHDGVNFATGIGHDGGIIQGGDSGCVTCHPTTVGASGATGLPSVQETHGRFYEKTTNANFLRAFNYNGVSRAAIPAAGHQFNVDLVGVTIDAAGRPTFTVDARLDGSPFDMVAAATVTSASGPVVTNDPMGGRLPTCAFVVAGPTTDFTFPATGAAQVSCTAVLSVGGPTTVLLTPVLDGLGAPIPGRFSVTQPAATCTTTACTATTPVFRGATAGTFKTGAWSVSYEIMYQRQMTVGTGTVRKPFSANPVFLTVWNSGTAAAPIWNSTVRGSGTPEDLALSRRAVVSFDKCNNCHVDLGFHSNRSRKGPDYCAVCHNPKLDNGTRARVPVAKAYTTAATGSQLVYLPESVSMNVFIHRIHMGSDLPSVSAPTQASPWVPEPGSIIYGATRSAFVGVDAVKPPELADFTAFAMPNPMGRCDQCHLSNGAQQTWALPEMAGLAPVERTYRTCTPTTPSWASEAWCNNTSNNGMPTTTAALPVAVKVVTPPLKATCTSCHDSLATDVHADMYTTSPMTAGATELCATCHGAGKAWDALGAHRGIP